MTDAYRFRLLDLTPAELQQTSELLRLVFPAARHLTARYLHWHLAENPDGRAVGCNATLGDQLVGHMASMPIRATMDGVERRGLFMTNGAVHPAHRGRKLQSRISDAMFDDAAAQGYQFVLGTGNKYSTGPLLTRFRLIAPLDARLGFGALRRRAGSTPSLERRWNVDALNWRLSNPELSYRVARRGDAMTIIAPTGRPGIGATLYAGPDLPEIADRHGDLAGCGPLRVWIGLDPGMDWARSTYWSIPTRLRPSPLNLVFKDLSGQGLYPDPSRLVFRALDFDPY